ncbi:hypothetical protein H5410_024085 [Solanum commersonii]|uniref:Uncharacterized protein n=1 Tax=Solanum commersonii TaxID=4109 RepID=A0A9J5ZKZ7_SOLCO|nr:hypothetical protein H5410_024085 [Solanum commersonii]
MGSEIYKHSDGARFSVLKFREGSKSKLLGSVEPLNDRLFPFPTAIVSKLDDWYSLDERAMINEWVPHWKGDLRFPSQGISRHVGNTSETLERNLIGCPRIHIIMDPCNPQPPHLIVEMEDNISSLGANDLSSSSSAKQTKEITEKADRETHVFNSG